MLYGIQQWLIYQPAEYWCPLHIFLAHKLIILIELLGPMLMILVKIGILYLGHI